MRCVLGIDAGGTSTRCLLVSEDATVLGVGYAGPGNPLSAGSTVAMDNLAAAIRLAVRGRPSDAEEPELVVLAVAGGANTEDLTGLAARLLPMGLRVEVTIESDLVGAYFSGRTDPNGYLLLSGTGAVAGRIASGRLTQVSDGLGWLLGDEGSGFWIGHQGAIAAMRSIDGRGPKTPLTEAFLDMYRGAPTLGRVARSADVSALLEQVYRKQRPVQLAGFAGTVCELAETDPVARGIVERAAEALIVSWRSVVVPGVAGTVLAGGVLTHSRLLQSLITAEVGAATIVDDGLVGAGVLALRQLGVPCDEAQREAIAAGVALASADPGSGA